MWYFIRRPPYEHQCSPLPIDKTKVVAKRVHSEHRAGFDIIETTHKLSECPVCKATYTYDLIKKEVVGFEPYKGEVK